MSAESPIIPPRSIHLWYIWKKVRFQCNEQGLYIYKLDNSFLEAVKNKNLINTGVEK